ncbi:M23 family metallopeptidase [Sphingomonas sp.]|uniref:M23 family metallopeptidase n=1 Tax=Sphingomonas sp. TaxID=28214 RepID=UPI002DE4281F|nr:M23 family metallopeptidase [Sphingomonas sp.]
MTRLGWILLLLFVLAGVALGLMLNPGGEADEPAPSVAAAPADGLVIPVAGIKPQQLTDSWGDSRGGGSRRHNAIDIMAPKGTPVVAAAPGLVEKLFDSVNGGRTVYVRSNDGTTVYYYAHLDSYRYGLREGQRVGAGDVIGTVGSTGSASEDGPHLHFEVKRMDRGERWHQGREVNPYPLLAGKAAAR